MSCAQQAPCIGMHQLPSTCAEALQSNLVWDALKHTSDSKGVVRVVQAVQDWESPRGPVHRHWKSGQRWTRELEVSTSTWCCDVYLHSPS